MSVQITEARLKEALNRLLANKPTRTKVTGKLTLNKINKEAGLGNSYIHKFPDFVAYAKPIIDEHNLTREKVVASELGIDTVTPLVGADKLKDDVARERRLKEKYKAERDAAIAARKLLEADYAKLMFRAFEMQNELAKYKTLPLKR